MLSAALVDHGMAGGGGDGSADVGDDAGCHPHCWMKFWAVALAARGRPPAPQHRLMVHPETGLIATYSPHAGDGLITDVRHCEVLPCAKLEPSHRFARHLKAEQALSGGYAPLAAPECA